MTRYTFRGKSQSLPAWSRELGIPESTLRSRLGKLGLSIDEAFTRPVDDRFHPRPSPPPAAVPAVPPLERHARGQARCRWTDGGRVREKWFGKFGSEEAAQAYSRWCAEWYSTRGKPTPSAGETVLVGEVIDRYLTHAEATFRKRGRITSEVHGIRSTLRRVNDVYGDTPAGAFGPQQLRAVMDAMVREGLSAKTVNDYRGRVVRCWGWAVGQGLIPAAVAAALEYVETLVSGRTHAAMSVPVQAARDEDVERIIPHLHAIPEKNAILAAAVRVARVTGMRPGEVCSLRPVDLDRSRVPWKYQPADGGKALHLDKNRVVWIGPRGRALLEPLLTACGPTEFVFRVKRRRGGGDVRVTERFLRDCVNDACKRVGVPKINPNQLRHARGTEVYKAFEDDAAVAAALGNSPEVARQVYVDNPAEAVAKRIAEATG